MASEMHYFHFSPVYASYYLATALPPYIHIYMRIYLWMFCVRVLVRKSASNLRKSNYFITAEIYYVQ